MTTIEAGMAQVEITPEAGTHLAGSEFGKYRPAQSILDPLFVKVVVFKSEEQKICLVGLDVTIITEKYSSQIRTKAKELYDFEPDSVLVYSTQTHSAPACGSFLLDPDFPLETNAKTEYLKGSESAYSEHAAQSAIKAIGDACFNMEEVQVGIGSGMVNDLAFNRRAITKDGNVIMPGIHTYNAYPFGPIHISHLEGPSDREVGVFGVRTRDMRLKALLLNFTCHPVNVFINNKISYYAVSADWPGSWSYEMKKLVGEDCVSLVLNGCCGNINPWNPFDPNFVIDHHRMGSKLSKISSRIIQNMSFDEDTKIDWCSYQLPLSYREIPEKRLQEVKQILSTKQKPRLDKKGKIDVDPEWFTAASTKSIEYCKKRMPDFLYEIQVFRIGDTAIIGLPGEPFVEGQLEIKIKSPAKNTLITHCATHYAGYVPIEEAYQRGGHEANTNYTSWARLAKGSLEKIVEKTIELLSDLFEED